MMKYKKALLLLIIFFMFSSVSMCAESSVYIDNNELSDVKEVVLSAKRRAVKIQDIKSGRIKAMDIYGKLVFSDQNPLLDERMNKKARFEITVKSIKENNEQKLTFVNCIMDGKFKEKGLWIYRIIAEDIR